MSAIVEHQLEHGPILAHSKKDLPPLTPKQKKFLSSYLECRKGIQAAREAGYAGNDIALAQVAHETLRKPNVQAHLQWHLRSRAISSESVLAELGDIASAPWKDFVQVKYGPNNQILDVQLRLSEKLKALELAGKFHRLWDRPADDSPSDPSAVAAALYDLLKLAAERKRTNAEPVEAKMLSTGQDYIDIPVVNNLHDTPITD
jgi:hypothetical protein